MNAGSFLKNLSCQKIYIKNYGIRTLKTLMKVDEGVSFYPQDYTKNFKPWVTFWFHWREFFVKVRVNSMIIISQVWILLRTNLLQEEKTIKVKRTSNLIIILLYKIINIYKYKLFAKKNYLEY